MLPPELPIFAARLDLDPARLLKPGAAEAIERMHAGGPSKQCLEASEQQRHGEHVLLVVEEDRFEGARVALAQPREVTARDQAAGEIVGTMQVEHTLLDGLQRTVGQAWPKDPPRQREQVEVGRRRACRTSQNEPRLQEWPVKAAAVVADQHAGLADALAHCPQQRLLLVEVAQEVLSEGQSIPFPPGQADQKGDGAGPAG